MLPGMPARARRELRIAMIGAGNLAHTLALALQAANYTIDEIVSRANTASIKRAQGLAREVHAHAASIYRAQLRGEIVWFCVPDREIASAAKTLSEATDWGGKIALHSSGALSSEELESLRKKGAAVGSVHPLMTFVRGSQPSLKGVPFALEGDAKALRAARGLVLRLRGEPFMIQKRHKEAYHAWGMFSSPLFVALLAAAERVARAAGIPRDEARRRMLPILRQTLANYEQIGAGASFSGPLARGDVATIKKHLHVLQNIRGARQAYAALAGSALRDLPVKDRSGVEETLGTASVGDLRK
jgi:predicted short-subunit dehydrogenase-like oxidoreductase (DUF2520 family)